MDHIRIVETFPDHAPDDLWAAWTTSEGVASFWAESADVEATVGGDYLLRWPSMDWTLRGEVLAVDPGRSISFSWRWDHESTLPTRQVVLTFEPDGAGSRLIVEHGPYGESEAEASERESNEAGWRHFCSRLRGDDAER